jgi:hypothetical protein
VNYAHPIALFALALLSLAFGLFIGVQWPRRANSKANRRAKRIEDLTIQLATSPFGANLIGTTIARHDAEDNAERLYIFAETIINELDRRRKSIS